MLKKVIIPLLILALLQICEIYCFENSSGSLRSFINSKGQEITEVIISGKPPENYEPVNSSLNPTPNRDTVFLNNVPAYQWSYGCSPTAASMITGYYDRTGYPNIYTGPTNNGVAPETNEVWGSTQWPSGIVWECPLSATHQGIDGLTNRGHVDDYWVDYLSTEPDPFITNNWDEHSHADCTGDFMGSNQSELGNIDGSTMFYFATDGTKLYDYILCEPQNRDGCHGLKLFFESKEYIVPFNGNYTQYIQGWNGNTYGFTFNEFKQEINNGYPLLVHTENHTMVGFGYNDSYGDETIYFRNTWDFSYDEMTWGGTYQGSPLIGVTVVHLEPIQLTVTPEMRTVGLPSGSTIFFVDISGSTSSTWTAEVVYGQDWMQITSGSSGVGNGVITVNYDELIDPNGSRVGEIVVTCPEATSGSPASGIVMQLDATNVYPGQSIQTAIDWASSGVVITVHPGIYEENIIFDNKDITVESLEGPQNTIIQGVTGPDASSVVIFLGDFCDGAWLKGFTLKGGVGYEFGDDIVHYGGGIYCSNASPTLENLLITDNTTHRGGGLACYDCSSPTLLNVTITNNHATNSGNNGCGGAIHCEVNSHPVLLNTILFDNTSDFQSEEIYFDDGGAPCSITIDYSDVKGGQEGIVTNNNGNVFWGNSNIDADPLFTDPANGVYSLQWNEQHISPCIDSGEPTIIDPDETPSDMGAFRAVDHDFHLTTAEVDRYRYRSFPVIDRDYMLQGFETTYICAPVETQTNYFYIFDQDENYQEWDGIYQTWSGYQLETLDSVKGYKLRTISNVEIPTSGITLPENTQVDLVAGRNWVGYFVKESMGIQDAFQDIWDHILSVSGEDWAWLSPGIPSSRCVLIYGKMYIVHVDEACSFVYGDGTPVPPEEREMTEGFYYVETPEYSPINIESLDDPTVLEVGIFLDGECIGATQVEEFPLQILAFPAEGGSGSGDITFEFYCEGRSYKPAQNYKVLNKETGQYVNSKIELNPYEFTTICFGNPVTPAKFTLSGNYPNPFNPTTTISYSIPTDGNVELIVYNIRGQKVKTLISGTQPTGVYNITWNGKDENSRSVSSSVYFYKLRSSGKTAVKKMLLLK